MIIANTRTTTFTNTLNRKFPYKKVTTIMCYKYQQCKHISFESELWLGLPLFSYSKCQNWEHVPAAGGKNLIQAEQTLNFYQFEFAQNEKLNKISLSSWISLPYSAVFLGTWENKPRMPTFFWNYVMFSWI